MAGKKEKKPRALGYEDGDITQFHEVLASEFLQNLNPLLLLSQTSSIVLDSELTEKSVYTTAEVRECLKDVKVCGPGELRSILTWRKKILAGVAAEKRAKDKEAAENATEEVVNEEDMEMQETEEIDELIRNAQADEKSKVKKQKRSVQKEKTKLAERGKLQMDNSEPIVSEDLEVFSLKKIQRIVAKRKLGATTADFDGGHDTTEDFGEMSAHNFEDAELEDRLEEAAKKKRRLTPEQLAMGELLTQTKSAKDLEDWAWNRYTSNDDGLPNWFLEDEQKHCRRELPVEKERVDLYKKREQELNIRPIKKVVEAKMRKKLRQTRRLEKAKKRAEGVVDNENLEHGEKIRELKKIYNRATKVADKKKVKVQVMTKGKRGALQRPKGPYKCVDARLKKDTRGKRKAEKGGSGKGGGKGRGSKSGGGGQNKGRKTGRKSR